MMKNAQRATAELDAACQSAPDWAHQLDDVLESWQPRTPLGRRQQTRAAVPVTFQLTPLDKDGNRLDHDAFTVFGKNISPGGIAFRHDRRFSQRRAILALEHPQVGRLEVEAEILWTRLAEPGWYESGAALLHTVEGHAIKIG